MFDKSKRRNKVAQTFNGYSVRVIIWNPAREQTAGFCIAKKCIKGLDKTHLALQYGPPIMAEC